MSGGLNLHGIVRGVVTAVNADETVAVSSSNGTTPSGAGDGTVVPVYTTASFGAQVQPLSGRDLRQIASLNLQGTLKKIYLYGDVEAIVRNVDKGGDLVMRSDGSVWKTTIVFEGWDTVGWCAIGCTLQTDGS
jgi:hypothetical protein